jgi:hypothetical protein
VSDELADNHVEPESKDHDDCANDHGESHLINFSLLNTLLPDIELE